MKRIVILCDGTWNEPDSQHPTNVVRIAQAMRVEDDQGVAQVPIYVPGVGTGKGVTKVSRFLDRTLGGMFGWGLFENIIEAYRHLVFLYEPGDKIYVFGFSRGAFTARSLTGFIRSTGIIRRDSLHYLPEAVARYQTRNKDETHHPDAKESHAFRLKMSPDIATSQEEIDWRENIGLKPPRRLRVAYLGVWDSVGALGVPAHYSIAGLLNRKYRFHDANLSSMVTSARHAVAIDERRRTFEPTRWKNLSRLNKKAGLPEPPYLEKFFLGDHGSVGGGGDLTHLSSIALAWIIDGAQNAELGFDPWRVSEIVDEHDISGLLRNTKDPPGGLRSLILRLSARDRDGPENAADLHPSVLTRWALASDTPYRPGSLARHETRIAALIEDAKTRIT